MEPERDPLLLRLRNVPLMRETEVPRLHGAAVLENSIFRGARGDVEMTRVGQWLARPTIVSTHAGRKRPVVARN